MDLPEYPKDELPIFPQHELPDYPKTELPPFPQYEFPNFPFPEIAFPGGSFGFPGLNYRIVKSGMSTNHIKK